MKKMPALIAGIITSSLLVLIVIAVGINALLNPNTVAEASAPGSAVDGSGVVMAASVDSIQTQQLQARILEYQAREKQYQARLSQTEADLAQANSDLQQYQQLVMALQQAGLLRIDRDGRIFLPRFQGDQ